MGHATWATSLYEHGLIPELLAQDAFVEAVTGIEQHVHGGRVIHADLDRADGSHLVVIGDGGDRPLVAFEHVDPHAGAVGQERAAPAPRPERADRGSAISGAPIGMIGPCTERL